MKNKEWGFGIFHEIIEDENRFHPVSASSVTVGGKYIAMTI
jgi:hypothetical protein